MFIAKSRSSVVLSVLAFLMTGLRGADPAFGLPAEGPSAPCVCGPPVCSASPARAGEKTSPCCGPKDAASHASAERLAGKAGSAIVGDGVELREYVNRIGTGAVKVIGVAETIAMRLAAHLHPLTYVEQSTVGAPCCGGNRDAGGESNLQPTGCCRVAGANK